MRRWLLLLLLIPTVLAQTLKPISVVVDISLKPDGRANITESYLFTPSDYNELQNISTSFGYSYSAWKRYVEGLHPHVCTSEVGEGSVTVVLKEENGVPSLTMSYTCKPATTVSEDFLYITYRLDRIYFPVISGLMVLPEGYSIRLRLPQNAKVVSVAPQTTAKEGTILWKGPLSTAKRFEVVYTVPKTYTVPSISTELNRLVSDPRVTIAVVVLALLVFVLRDKIKKAIGGFVARFTELEKE